MDDVTATVEETFQRLKARSDVIGVFLLNAEGQQIKSSFNSGTLAQKYAQTVRMLVKSVRGALEHVDVSAAVRLFLFYCDRNFLPKRAL